MEQKVRFHLPGLRYNYPLNMYWVSLLEQYPEYFRPNIEIGSFFGTFPYAIWNGGRLMHDDQCDSDYVRGVIQAMNSKGIPVRYTFTNPCLVEEDFKDPYCNFLMQAANNGMNEVMVFDPKLEAYLRDKYPNFAYNSSTCKEIRNTEELNAEIEKPYKYVVLDYNLNNRWDLLENVQHKEKLEVLINTLCIPNCPRRGEHYKNIGRNERIILENRKLPMDQKKPIEPWYCEYGDNNCIHNIKGYPTFISVEDIYEKYMPAGINNFKIEGRSAYIFSLIDTYCYYMLKEECVGEARLQIIKNLEKSGVIAVRKPRPAMWP
ncbi:MAG: hypothetical protein MJ124_01805 [Lachnospiraceae bacterium]|nr:hypothetical protein [Lachnospiraceae bacterium]